MNAHRFLYRALLLFVWSPFVSHVAVASNATWNLNSVTDEWNNVSNWTPATVPGQGEIATFDVSNTTDITVAGNGSVSGVIFDPGASAYTIGVGTAGILSIGPNGVVNNSGITQNFVAGVDAAGNQGGILFTLTGSAGSLTAFTAGASLGSGGTIGAIDFVNFASGGNGSFINRGGAVNGSTGGLTQFFNQSTAGNATFTCEGGLVSGAGGGLMQFLEESQAASAILIALGGTNGGNGGEIDFLDSSTADTARIEVFGNGILDLGGTRR